MIATAVPRLLGKLLDQSPSSDTCPAGISNSTLSSLAMVVLGGGLASFIRTTMLNQAEDSIASRLRSQAFGALLTRRNLQDFQTIVDSNNNTTTMTPAAMLHILQDDVTVVAHSITANVANLIRSSCSCFFGTYHMLQLNPTLFGVSASIVPLIGTAAMLLRKVIQRVATKQRDTASLAASFAQERLTQIHMVKMSDRQNSEVQAYTKYQHDVVRFGRLVSLANGSFMGFIFAASSGALFLVFHQGGRAVAAGTMTAGDLTSFATYTFLLGLGTSGVLKALSEMSQGMIAAERVYQLMPNNDQGINDEDDMTTNTPITSKQIDPPTVIVASVTSMALQHVDFSFKSNPKTKVLKDISFEMTRGKVVVLVGQNGSGKTTIASLLAALYTPTSGRIILDDGTDLFSLPRDVQRRLVQVVPQDPVLFNLSILDNVRYATPHATEKETIAAMALANCNELISKHGIHYNVGLAGNQLSGGQRQRIGLARALLVDPAVLVLDEPTSALDHSGETAVADAVEACRFQNRALLLITHRTKSLALADVIVVLKEGKVVEIGTFDDLTANKDSEFCALMPDFV